MGKKFICNILVGLKSEKMGKVAINMHDGS